MSTRSNTAIRHRKSPTVPIASTGHLRLVGSTAAREWWVERPLLGVPLVVWFLLLIRTGIPIMDSPYAHLTSDMRAHYQCGRYMTLFTPFAPNRAAPVDSPVDCEMENALHPKPFQVLMMALNHTGERLGSLVMGLLSACVLVGVFFALRITGVETRPSWIATGIIGLCPTLLWCFSYFLNETLMLTLLSLGLLTTAVALRPSRKDREFLWMSVAFWLLALSTLTKLVALPCLLAWVLCFGLRWVSHFRSQIVPAVLQGMVLVLLLGVFSVHTHRTTGFYSPFGKSLQSVILRKAGSCTATLTIHDEQTGISHSSGTNTPLCGLPILGLSSLGAFRPFMGEAPYLRFSYSGLPARFDVAMEGLESLHSFAEGVSIWWQNLVLGMTAPSFPEGYRTQLLGAPSLLARWSEWTARLSPLPLLLVLLAALYVACREWAGPLLGKKAMNPWLRFLSLAVLVSWLCFLVQQEGVFESRYRKALDLVSLLVVVQVLCNRRTTPPNQLRLETPS